jgi:hypothetical protein
MSKLTGGQIPPGRTWGGLDQTEALYPVVGSVAVEHLGPIPLSERLPGKSEVADAGPCSLVWLGHEIPGGYWSWELTDVCFAPDHTHWLPASVRYLPARVGL